MRYRGAKDSSRITAVHFLRSYGASGGERQLRQYFDAEPKDRVDEQLVLLYHDPDCEALFQRVRAITLRTLWPFRVRPRGAWAEFLVLLILLPLLQVCAFCLLARVRPNVCVAHGFHAALILWPIAVLKRSIPFVYVHRITKSTRGPQWVFRLLYRPFRAVAGVSKAVTASLAPYASTSRLATLENGIDLRTFENRAQSAGLSAGQDDLVVITTGRLLPYKGQEIVLRAFSRLRERFQCARLWIAGDGPELPSLQSEAFELGLEADVKFLGHRSDVPFLLASSTIFAYASNWEGMSNAVLEAMALGLPSVVCDAPGVTECHIPDETALVVERSEEALARGLIQLAENADMRKRMGAAARLRVRSVYSIESNRKRYLQLFDELVNT